MMSLASSLLHSISLADIPPSSSCHKPNNKVIDLCLKVVIMTFSQLFLYMKKFTRIKTLFVVLLVTGCGGCVSRISMSEQSPTPSYQSKERTVVSIIDKRDSTKIGNPLNYIGRSATGIDDNSGLSLMVYPRLFCDRPE